MTEGSVLPIRTARPAGKATVWTRRYDVEVARSAQCPPDTSTARSTIAGLTDALGRVLALPVSALLVAGSPDVLTNGLVAGRRLVDRWAFYADPAYLADASAFFAEPPVPSDVDVSRTRHLLATPGKGTVTDVRYPSTFVPVNPALRDEYLADVRNRTVHARWWRHAEGPRPTIVCVHGLQAGYHVINVEFFDVRRLYVDGYDVVLIQLPYHGARATLIDGWSYLSLDMAHLAEVIAHSISDIRSLISLLLDRGAPQVGIKGVSLGGYLTALLASVDPRPAFAIPVAAPVSLADLVTDLFPFGRVLPRMLSTIGWDIADLRRHMACHTPLQHPVLLDRDRLMIVAASQDSLVKPYHSSLLREHWATEIVWRRGSHQIHLDRAAYERRLAEFLESIGFMP